MKKLIFTIATVVAFTSANAQEVKQEPVAKKKTATATTSKKTTATTAEPVNAKSEKGATGTTTESTATNTATPESKKTRMAINEKGLPGEKKAKNTGTTTNPK